jgi:hypothetical protein
MILTTSARVGEELPVDCEFDVFCGPPLSAQTRVGWTKRLTVKMIVRLSRIDLNFFIRSSLSSQIHGRSL